MKNGAVYIRVSTDKQEELSPDAQKRLILEYAKKNNILITSDFIFTENGISGRKAEKRPEFQKMIGFAKSKEKPFEVILVWKFSRFARNQEESIVYKSLLKKNDIEVISISEPLIDGPFGSLIERIIEWMDEYYSIRLSGEVIRGMTENAMRGAYQSVPPLGYDYVGRKEVPIVNEKEKEVIQFIYAKYLEGNPLTRIARELNENGIFSKKGNKFEARTIEYILKNPFYIGKIRWNYSSRGRELKEESEWIVSQGKHKSIVSEEIFNKTQEKLLKNVRKMKSRDVSVCKHWLSGVLVCSSCGRSLSFSKASRNKKTYNHFQCWGYAKGMCEKSHSLPEWSAIDSVIIGLEKATLSDKICYKVLRDKEKNDSELEILNESLKGINKKEDRIKQAYRNGIDTLDEYRENKEIITKEKMEIERKIKEIDLAFNPSTKNIDDEKIIQNIGDVISVLKSEDIGFEEKGKAIRSVVQKIVYNKEDFSFDFHFYLQ